MGEAFLVINMGLWVLIGLRIIWDSVACGQHWVETAGSVCLVAEETYNGMLMCLQYGIGFKGPTALFGLRLYLLLVLKDICTPSDEPVSLDDRKRCIQERMGLAWVK